MAYQENIPQPTDIQSVSQNDILQNFTTLDTAWDINHVPFDHVDQGKHNKVHLPNQDAIVPIDPVTSGTETALYSKTSTRTTVTEMFVRPRNSGTEIPITAKLGATPGWAYLPNGLLIKWGASTRTGAQNVVFVDDGDVLIPRFGTIYSVQLTVSEAGAADTDTAVRVTDISNPLQIGVFASPRITAGNKAVTFDYLAIGVGV